MKYHVLILVNIFVILCCVVVLYLDATFGYAYNQLLILFFALAKLIFFIGYGYKNLLRFAAIDLSYHKFLAFISLNILVIIFSFTADFFCLYQVDATSFEGIDARGGMAEAAFNFFYFSFLIFSNIGITTILPLSIVAKCLTIFETTLSFITIIFMLSDFISLKQSLTNNAR